MAGTHDMSGDRNAAVTRLLWAPRPQPKRGPKPTLSLDAIARTGVDVADAEGLAAVTMHRIADALGVTKMALYRYVPGKVELIALMTETGLGEPPPMAEVSGGWRPRMHTWSHRMFDRFWRHPWTLETTVGARIVGPHELGWLEQAVASLAGTGLEGGEALDVVMTLVGHVRTIAQQGTASGGDRPERTAGASLPDLLREHADRFPALAQARDSAARNGTRDQALDFGLHRILDGVELLIASRTPHRDER